MFQRSAAEFEASSMINGVPETNQTILSRFINEAWNNRRHEVCDELLAPDYRHYMPGAPEPSVGAEAYRQLLTAFISAFPDIRLDIDEIFGQADRVCALWTLTGTHQGVFNGVPPTGRKVKLSGVAVARVRDAKIQEVRSMFDSASLLQQLGA